MNTSRRRRVLLLLAVLSLPLGWLLTPASAPPLYDGVGFPDEPYRYVQPPLGYRHTAAPTAATKTARPDRGMSPEIDVATAEAGPQASVFLPDGSLTLAPGATAVTVSAAPLAPSVQPADGTVDGNLYRVTGTTPQGPATLSPRGRSLSAIQLRATSARQPGPVVELFSDGHWRQLQTARTGNDLYQSFVTGFGDYALVFLRHPPSPAASRSGAGGIGGAGLAAIVAGLLLILGALTLGGIRLTRLRAADAAANDLEEES